jgi:hypothetical protein
MITLTRDATLVFFRPGVLGISKVALLHVSTTHRNDREAMAAFERNHQVGG